MYMQQVEHFFNFIKICMSYVANASMYNLKVIYPFIILYAVPLNMS